MNIFYYDLVLHHQLSLITQQTYPIMDHLEHKPQQQNNRTLDNLKASPSSPIQLKPDPTLNTRSIKFKLNTENTKFKINIENLSSIINSHAENESRYKNQIEKYKSRLSRYKDKVKERDTTIMELLQKYTRFPIYVEEIQRKIQEIQRKLNQKLSQFKYTLNKQEQEEGNLESQKQEMERITSNFQQVIDKFAEESSNWAKLQNQYLNRIGEERNDRRKLEDKLDRQIQKRRIFELKLIDDDSGVRYQQIELAEPQQKQKYIDERMQTLKKESSKNRREGNALLQELQRSKRTIQLLQEDLNYAETRNRKLQDIIQKQKQNYNSLIQKQSIVNSGQQQSKQQIQNGSQEQVSNKFLIANKQLKEMEIQINKLKTENLSLKTQVEQYRIRIQEFEKQSEEKEKKLRESVKKIGIKSEGRILEKGQNYISSTQVEGGYEVNIINANDISEEIQKMSFEQLAGKYEAARDQLLYLKDKISLAAKDSRTKNQKGSIQKGEVMVLQDQSMSKDIDEDVYKNINQEMDRLSEKNKGLEKQILLLKQSNEVRFRVQQNINKELKQKLRQGEEINANLSNIVFSLQQQLAKHQNVDIDLVEQKQIHPHHNTELNQIQRKANTHQNYNVLLQLNAELTRKIQKLSNSNSSTNIGYQQKLKQIEDHYKKYELMTPQNYKQLLQENKIVKQHNAKISIQLKHLNKEQQSLQKQLKNIKEVNEELVQSIQQKQKIILKTKTQSVLKNTKGGQNKDKLAEIFNEYQHKIESLESIIQSQQKNKANLTDLYDTINYLNNQCEILRNNQFVAKQSTKTQTSRNQKSEELKKTIENENYDEKLTETNRNLIQQNLNLNNRIETMKKEFQQKLIQNNERRTQEMIKEKQEQIYQIKKQNLLLKQEIQDLVKQRQKINFENQMISQDLRNIEIYLQNLNKGNQNTEQNKSQQKTNTQNTISVKQDSFGQNILTITQKLQKLKSLLSSNPIKSKISIQLQSYHELPILQQVVGMLVERIQYCWDILEQRTNQYNELRQEMKIISNECMKPSLVEGQNELQKSNEEKNKQFEVIEQKYQQLLTELIEYQNQNKRLEKEVHRLKSQINVYKKQIEEVQNKYIYELKSESSQELPYNQVALSKILQSENNIANPSQKQIPQIIKLFLTRIKQLQGHLQNIEGQFDQKNLKLQSIIQKEKSFISQKSRQKQESNLSQVNQQSMTQRETVRQNDKRTLNIIPSGTLISPYIASAQKGSLNSAVVFREIEQLTKTNEQLRQKGFRLNSLMEKIGKSMQEISKNPINVIQQSQRQQLLKYVNAIAIQLEEDAKKDHSNFDLDDDIILSSSFAQKIKGNLKHQSQAGLEEIKNTFAGEKTQQNQINSQQKARSPEPSFEEGEWVQTEQLQAVINQIYPVKSDLCIMVANSINMLMMAETREGILKAVEFLFANLNKKQNQFKQLLKRKEESVSQYGRKLQKLLASKYSQQSSQQKSELLNENSFKKSTQFKSEYQIKKEQEEDSGNKSNSHSYSGYLKSE